MKTRGSNYRLKHYDFWFLGKNISGVIYPWDNFLGGSFPRVHLSEKQLCRRQIIQKVIFFRGNFQGDIFGGNHPGGNYPGGNIPREQLSSGAIIWKTNIRGAIFLGGNCLRGIIWGAIIQQAIVQGAIFLWDNCPFLFTFWNHFLVTFCKIC